LRDFLVRGARIYYFLLKSHPVLELSGVTNDENIVNLDWLGEYDVTADELLNIGKSNGDNGYGSFMPKIRPRDKAKQFLLNTLTNTPMDKNDVVNATAEQCVKEETLRRAREELGVITETRGNRLWWLLPQKDEYAFICAQFFILLGIRPRILNETARFQNMRRLA